MSSLDFSGTALQVAYRESPEPQTLALHIKIAREPVAPYVNVAVANIVDAIQLGAAGGRVFDPRAGQARVLNGPMTDEEAVGDEHHFTLEVVGVARTFMRNVVEQLSLSGVGYPVTTISVVGSVPTDQSDRSVTTPIIQYWLANAKDYPEAWGQWPFRVIDGGRHPHDDRTELRVLLDGLLTADTRQRLEELCQHWVNFIQLYRNERGGEVQLNPHKSLPAFGQAKDELRAFFPEFLWTSQSAKAVLLNMLTRFHHEQNAILEVEVAL